MIYSFKINPIKKNNLTQIEINAKIKPNLFSPYSSLLPLSLSSSARITLEKDKSFLRGKVVSMFFITRKQIVFLYRVGVIFCLEF